MSEPQSSEAEPSRPDAPDALSAPVEVAVTRTGGFAGLTKRWLAEPGDAEASDWIALITQCPWDAPADVAAAVRADAGDGPGADRFTWWIRARCGEQVEREAELPDHEVVGAWRDLIDAVRGWNRSGNA